MAGLIVRIGVLTVGFGLAEIVVTDILSRGALLDWGLLLLVVFPLLVLGTSGFLAPMFQARTDEGTPR